MNVDSPEQLAALMGHDWLYSKEQFAAITADLEPAVVVAGAGSGKTAVMAARVVWLVATGQVAPGEVLGLTFTTKATAELQHRIRDSLLHAGLLPERGPRRLDPDETDSEEDDAEEPTVATYHAYAAALLSEHGLRIGHEPDTRLIADASRYQLAARAIQRHRGSINLLTDSPTHAVRYLLALDSEMAEHLVSPDEVRAHDAAERPRFAVEHDALLEQLAEGKKVKGRVETVGDAIAAIDKRAELLGLVDDYRALKSQLGLMDFSRPDRTRRPAGAGLSRGRRDRARQVQGGAARRIPGHLRRAGHDAVADLRRRPSGHGGG